MTFAGHAIAIRLEHAEAQGCVEYARALAAIDPSSGACSEPLAGGYLAFAGAGGPLSRAAGLGMTLPVRSADLDRVEAFYAERGGPAQVDLCPLADRSLLEGLSERGYRIAEFNTVLVRPLPPGEELPEPPPDVEVAPAHDADEELWSRTVAAGFASDEGGIEELARVARPLFRMASAVPFLARVGGEPAGGGVLTLRDGLAALFGTSTVPGRRRMGVQTALLAARLRRAAEAGADLAVCYALPGSGSQRNVERLGFRVAYTKLVLSRELPAR